MHIQETSPGWTDALPRLPAGALVLSVSNPSTLREAKQINPAVITAARHYVGNQQFSDHYPTAVEIARGYFRSFIDRTYLEQQVQFVDLVLEYNEYYDAGMAANDPDVLKMRLLNATAMANVWNDEYRGRLVRSADGGEGFIPASCRLVIGNSPVGNDIPRAFAELAIATGNALGYHPYIRCSVRIYPGTIRDPGDWRWHSGRWHFMEQDWGLSKGLIWCFTETMPYLSDSQGWRHWLCLDGDDNLLVEMFRLWLLDVATTPAYREGRILGPGAWFTVGGGGQFQDYLLERNQLVRLADAAAGLWHPGKEAPMPTLEESAVVRSALAKLDEARALLAPLAPPKHTLANLTNQGIFNLFQKAFGPSYFTQVTVATDEAYLLAHRQELYHGPAIEDMPGLTDAQKAALIAAL